MNKILIELTAEGTDADLHSEIDVEASPVEISTYIYIILHELDSMHSESFATALRTLLNEKKGVK